MLNPYSWQVKRRGPLKKRLLWQYSYPLDSNGFKSNGGIISGLQSLGPKHNILERGLRGGDQPNMNQKLFLEPPTPSPCLRLCQMG